MSREGLQTLPRAALLMAALLMAALLAAPAWALEKRNTTIYRCGPDGRQLSDRPCPTEPGASKALAFDQPSTAESAAARQRAASDAALAKNLQQQRERLEAQPQGGATGIRSGSAASDAAPARPAVQGDKPAKARKAGAPGRPASR